MMIKLEKNIFLYLLTTHRMVFSGIFPLVATTCKIGLVGRFGRRERSWANFKKY